MRYTLLSVGERTARKPHRCIWCGEHIEVGSRYTYEASTYYGNFQHHHWHTECYEGRALEFEDYGDLEFEPYRAERPPSAGAIEYASWLK